MFWKLVAAVCVAALVGACTSSHASSPTPSAPSGLPSTSTGPTSTAGPAIDPANFVSKIDNPYYPLIPGTTFVYEGVKDGDTQRDMVEVTSETKVVAGVACVVVRDTATHEGGLLEKTDDWYAQDKEGNVWYFGEDTAEYEHGKVTSREGAWETGVNGAVPGIVMLAHPTVPSSYRQEYYQGQAEDMAWVVSLDQKIKTPYRDFDQSMLTIEWTTLEPGVIDRKYYVSGIGLVAELSASGPNETAELVSVSS